MYTQVPTCTLERTAEGHFQLRDGDARPSQYSMSRSSYTFLQLPFSLSLSLYTYTHIYIYIHVYI